MVIYTYVELLRVFAEGNIVLFDEEPSHLILGNVGRGIGGVLVGRCVTGLSPVPSRLRAMTTVHRDG